MKFILFQTKDPDIENADDLEETEKEYYQVGIVHCYILLIINY